MAVGALLIDKKATKLIIVERGKRKEEREYSQPQNISPSTFHFPLSSLQDLSDSILQAARIKFTKTEYISCPGCGRTLYNLQETIARIKAATKDLVGLKIGIMGCIVNGPGEMADADYGYVGAGRGKISLYRAKECVEKNIPEAEAVDKLLELIRKDRK
jgi:(E)-4-hydroxy-3-methylbut-2-enyl-diphosphate synthase